MDDFCVFTEIITLNNPITLNKNTDPDSFVFIELIPNANSIHSLVKQALFSNIRSYFKPTKFEYETQCAVCLCCTHTRDFTDSGREDLFSGWCIGAQRPFD